MKKLLALFSMTVLFCCTFVSCSKDDVDDTVAVTSVSITEGSTYALLVGDSHTFRASVAPDNATSKSVTWSSSAANILTINAQTGAAEAKAAGQATITAKAGDKTATCVVTVSAVEVAVASVAITEGATYSLAVGDTHTFAATVSPDNATDKAVTWTSSKPDVLTINEQTGAAEAKTAGEATITAKAGDKTATCVVTVSAVEVAVASVAITEGATYSLAVGDTHTFVATVSPDNATDKAVTWTSSKPDVLTINEQTGAAEAKTAGEATITAKAGDKTATCVVTVNEPTVAVTGVNLTPEDVLLTLGDPASGTLQLTATVLPESATNKNVTYSIANDNIATVSNTGLLTAVNGGVTKVTVTTEDGSFTDELTVNVRVPLPQTSSYGYGWRYSDGDYQTLYLFTENQSANSGDPTEISIIYKFSDHNTYQQEYHLNFATSTQALAYTERLWKGEVLLPVVTGEPALLYTVDYTVSGNQIKLNIVASNAELAKRTQSEVVAQEEFGLVFELLVMLTVCSQNNGLFKQGGDVYYRGYEDPDGFFTYTLYYTVSPTTNKVTDVELKIEGNNDNNYRTLGMMCTYQPGFLDAFTRADSENRNLTIDLTTISGSDFVGLTLDEIIQLTNPEVAYMKLIELNSKYRTTIMTAIDNWVVDYGNWSAMEDGTNFFKFDDGEMSICFGFDENYEINHAVFEKTFVYMQDRLSFFTVLKDEIEYKLNDNTVTINLLDVEDNPFEGLGISTLVNYYTDYMADVINELITADSDSGIPSFPGGPNLPPVVQP